LTFQKHALKPVYIVVTVKGSHLYYGHYSMQVPVVVIVCKMALIKQPSVYMAPKVLQEPSSAHHFISKSVTCSTQR